MFFSADIRQADIVESLCDKKSSTFIILCAKTLEFDMKVKESICDANDVAMCQSNLVGPES